MSRTTGLGPVLMFSTLGKGSNEEQRIAELLSRTGAQLFPFDRKRKRQMFLALLRRLAKDRPGLAVMEGTGIAGGAALLLASFLFGTRYVVSSGDAVGPWIHGQYPLLGPLFALYERLLCARAAGFIGWTPYLVGRALTFGAPRAMTAPGWAPFPRDEARSAVDRREIRARLGISEQALVIGIAGSLFYARRYGFCYGMELVRALHLTRRKDVYVLVVGDGPGLNHLKGAAEGVSERVKLVGRVPQEEVPAYLAAMDLGSLPQSVDAAGSFRYTTKISEYLAAGLPLVTGQIPIAYDLQDSWIFRLPGDAPWSERYVEALAALLDRLGAEEVDRARRAVPRTLREFDRTLQVERATAFVADLLGRG